jgi:hypothetical protein
MYAWDGFLLIPVDGIASVMNLSFRMYIFQQNKCWCQSYATLFYPMILSDPKCMQELTFLSMKIQLLHGKDFSAFHFNYAGLISILLSEKRVIHKCKEALENFDR